jgi:hypothetical protein
VRNCKGKFSLALPSYFGMTKLYVVCFGALKKWRDVVVII